jgi:hypothetical protein
MRSTFGLDLRRSAHRLNMRRAMEKAVRPLADGAIPTSGRARSDAKRNLRAQAEADRLASV